MIRLEQYSKEVPLTEVAKRTYNESGVKHAGWGGYIVVKDDGKYWITYFRSTKPVQAMLHNKMSWAYPTWGLA